MFWRIENEGKLLCQVNWRNFKRYIDDGAEDKESIELKLQIEEAFKAKETLFKKKKQFIKMLWMPLVKLQFIIFFQNRSFESHEEKAQEREYWARHIFTKPWEMI